MSIYNKNHCHRSLNHPVEMPKVCTLFSICLPRYRSDSTSKNIPDSSSGASIPPDVLRLQTATPIRFVADSSHTKKTRSESSKSAHPVRSDAAHPRARDEEIDFAIRYVAGDQSSPFLVSSLASPEKVG